MALILIFKNHCINFGAKCIIPYLKGSLPFLQTDFQENGLRTKLIMAAYLIAGFRMGMGAIVVFSSGRLKHYEKQEFPRYLYIRQIWAKKGIEDENSLTFKLNMQKEIIVQCIANMGTLCIPLMVQAYGYSDMSDIP